MYKQRVALINGAQQFATSLSATGTHMPHCINGSHICHPPSRGYIHSHSWYRFSDLVGMQGWVDRSKANGWHPLVLTFIVACLHAYLTRHRLRSSTWELYEWRLSVSWRVVDSVRLRRRQDNAISTLLSAHVTLPLRNSQLSQLPPSH